MYHTATEIPTNVSGNFIYNSLNHLYYYFYTPQNTYAELVIIECIPNNIKTTNHRILPVNSLLTLNNQIVNLYLSLNSQHINMNYEEYILTVSDTTNITKGKVPLRVIFSNFFEKVINQDGEEISIKETTIAAFKININNYYGKLF